MASPLLRREELLREARRHLEGAEWALREASAELRRSPRQGFNKVFLAWKEAIAATVALAAAQGRDIAEALRRLQPSPFEDGRVVVTTGNAVRLLHRLQGLCGKGRCRGLDRVLRELLEARPLAYMLHTAYYEGAEHAGFADEKEAIGAAEGLARRLDAVAGELQRVAEELRRRSRVGEGLSLGA